MNSLTLVKRIRNINSKEATLGISEEASWHAKYKDSAYVFLGGIPFDLTEGDLLEVFAQYGEIVDVNLVRDKGTGKSKGFAFIAYEDQRSTNLAVDNLNGTQVLGRIIRVDHVSNYKKKEEEDEERERDRRGRHEECALLSKEVNVIVELHASFPTMNKATNTGWGPEGGKSSRWGHDRFEGSTKRQKPEGSEVGKESYDKLRELNSREQDRRDTDKRSEWKEKGTDHKEDWEKRAAERRPWRHNVEPNLREDCCGEEKRRRRDQSESYHKEKLNTSGRDRRSDHDRDSSSHRHRRIS